MYKINPPFHSSSPTRFLACLFGTHPFLLFLDPIVQHGHVYVPLPRHQGFDFRNRVFMVLSQGELYFVVVR
jgi:hypothetical protein